VSDDKRIEQIRARVAASASPLPWYVVPNQRVDESALVSCPQGFGDVTTWLAAGDAELIANAPTDLQWLLGELHRLQAVAAAARQWAAEFSRAPDPDYYAACEIELYEAVQRLDGKEPGA